MNWTLTVRGALEDDPALQEIVSILYRKTATPEMAAEVVAEAPKADPEPLYAPTLKAGVPALVVETAPEPVKKAPASKPAVENPEFAKAVDDMVAEAQAPAAKIAVADIQRAATKAMNAGKRDGVMAALKAHGGALKDVSEADHPALLAEIEAL